MNTEYISQTKAGLPALKKRFVSSVNYVRSFNGFSEYDEKKTDALFANDFLTCSAMLSGADCEISDNEISAFNSLFADIGITVDEKIRKDITAAAKKRFNASAVPDTVKYITDAAVFSGQENNYSKEETAAAVKEKVSAALNAFIRVLAVITFADGKLDKTEADFCADFIKHCENYVSGATGIAFSADGDLSALFTDIQKN